MRVIGSLPRRAKLALVAIVLVDAVVLFVPPSVTAGYGLSVVGHVLAITAVQGICAAFAVGVVVRYRADEEEVEAATEYKYHP